MYNPLTNLRKKIYSLRSDYTEREFYDLPLLKQRQILGLAEGQNPPKPSFLSAPNFVLPPRSYHA